MNVNRSKVYIMCGPAGSGKTFIAQMLESTGMTRLSFDVESFKRGVTTHPLSDSLLREIQKELDNKLIRLIESGQDVVLDYSFWSKEMRSKYIAILKRYSIVPLIFYVKTPIEVIVERIRQRTGKNENEIMLSVETAISYFEQFQVPDPDEGHIIVVCGN